MASYCTLVEVKENLDKTKTATDPAITALIARASAAIDSYTRRPDGYVALAVATARVYAGRGQPYLLIDENVAVTLVAAKEAVDDTAYTAWAAGDWLAFHGSPQNPDFNKTPYNGLFVQPDGGYASFVGGQWGGRGERGAVRVAMPTVQVTAKWGYAVTVPDPIKQACIIQVARWWRRGMTGYADATGNAEMGMLLYAKELDPEVRGLLFQGGWVRQTI